MGRTRRKNQSKCMSISPFAIEKTPFKDKPGNEINFDDCINPKPPHILMRSPLKLLKGNGLQQVLKNILDTDVGVDRKYLLNQVLDRETNYQTLLIELKKLLKQNSRLYLYIHLSQERVKSEGANEEIYPRKVVLQVLHFIVSHVGLPSLLGSKQNFKLFMKLVKKVVYGSHHQKFGLSSMVHGFKVSHILWLQQSLRSNSLRLNVLACLVKWLLCYVQNIVYKIWCLVPLSSKELVFYDRIKWQARKKIEIDAIIQRESIRPIENRELKDKVRHIGRTRFIIKPNGDLRPITKFMKASNPADITLRQNARMLVSQFAHFSGSTNTIFGPQIDRLLQDSLVKLLSCQPSFRRPPYYFVKADVKDAYGSIHHVTLVEMMNTVLETVGELEMRNVKMGRKSCIMFESPRLVIPSTVTKGSKVENSECQIQPICTHIEEFFAYSATKIDGQLYRIRHGIPQGMYLSAALCELYYSCLDSKYFGDFRNSKRDELFIRYCDDYLFLTPCKERAEKFLITCVTGFEHVTFNNAKLLTNLNETGISFVPFCGYTIDINTFQIQSNFLSYKNTNIVHSFDLTKTKNPGRLILSRMRIVLKLHLSLLDQRINGKFVALKNVYKASLLFAFRFYAYVNCYVPVGRLNQKFLIECIKRGLWVIKSKVLRAVARNEALRGVTKPTSKDAEWLLREEIKLVALKAFIARILKGGGVHQYPNILKYLKVTCSRIISKLKPDQLKLIETVTNPPLPETFNTMK